ncbi:MAG: protein translocase subunit SecF [bacterium]
MELFRSTNIDFISKRKYAYAASVFLLLVGVVSVIVRGGPNYGIDFKGGTSIVLRFEKEVTTNEIRNSLDPIGLGTSEIKRFGTRNEYVIYVAQQKGMSATEMAENVQSAISASLKDTVYEVRKVDTVGPKIGEELRKAMVLAILLALFLILIYIGWRFEFLFSVGAIVALFHDVLITLGIFILLNIEISLKEIAAMLTIVGYSLNDTIVVYDRIRENLKVLRNEPLQAIINKSINQTLSRTIVTSGTTFIVVLTLFILGGEVIKGFAFAMCIGVIVGTYSSIYVASPVVLEWQLRHGGKRELRMARKKIR